MREEKDGTEVRALKNVNIPGTPRVFMSPIFFYCTFNFQGECNLVLKWLIMLRTMTMDSPAYKGLVRSVVK